MKYFAYFILGFIALTIIGFTCGWFSDGAKTAKKEFAPSALLRKYEEFKDLSAGIDKKRADIDMYVEEIKNYKVTDKEDKFYLEQRKSELMGIISIHNTLCSQYNSAMSKFNYRFTNKGDLPQTNLDPLPREYKPYINSIH
jgi:hypothetical protein